MSGATLVLAAHPDDEVLGCGGAIARMADTRVRVYIAILADGVGARALDGLAHPDEFEQRCWWRRPLVFARHRQ